MRCVAGERTDQRSGAVVMAQHTCCMVAPPACRGARAINKKRRHHIAAIGKLRLAGGFVKSREGCRLALYAPCRYSAVASVFNGSVERGAAYNMRQNRNRIIVFLGLCEIEPETSGECRRVAKYSHVANRRARAVKFLPNA